MAGTSAGAATAAAPVAAAASRAREERAGGAAAAAASSWRWVCVAKPGAHAPRMTTRFARRPTPLLFRASLRAEGDGLEGSAVHAARRATSSSNGPSRLAGGLAWQRQQQQPQQQQQEEKESGLPQWGELSEVLLRSAVRRENWELVGVLAEAVAKQQSKLLQSAQQSVEQAAQRVQKLLQPLPSDFPPGPQTDSAVAMATDPLEFLDEMRTRYGTVVGLKLAGEPIVLVADPEVARQVLVTQADVFIKAGTAFFPGSSLAGNGLLVSDGEVWQRQRRLSNPAFRKSAIDSYAAAMVDLGKDLVERTWHGGGVRDVYADFNQLTMAIVVAALFGGAGSGSYASEQQQQSNHHKQQERRRRQQEGRGAGGYGSGSLGEVGEAISIAFEFFSRRATSMFIVPEWVPTPDNVQYNDAVARLNRVVYRMIAERREQLARSSEDLVEGRRSDLLTQLLQARDEDGSGMDDVSLRDELMTLLVAGQETSAILLAWTCVMLALHPHLQQRMRDELKLELEGRPPSHKDISKLKYTEAVIWETLRLMPPAYIVGRCACTNTVIGHGPSGPSPSHESPSTSSAAAASPSPDTSMFGSSVQRQRQRQRRSWSVPKGTTVLVSPYVLQRDPDFWPRADEFDPDRWMPGGDALPNTSNDSFWPFGGGPRNCIGMGFALMEASLILALIVDNFDMRLPVGATKPPDPRAMITLRPAGEVRLQLTPLQRT